MLRRLPEGLSCPGICKLPGRDAFTPPRPWYLGANLGAERDLLTEELGQQADHVELRVVAGIAGRQIVEAAREAGAQLIVLTTRGSVSLLIGTVSQYVLRKAPCPVMVVPAGVSAG